MARTDMQVPRAALTWGRAALLLPHLRHRVTLALHPPSGHLSETGGGLAYQRTRAPHSVRLILQVHYTGRRHLLV